jgi:hypothetical protein
LVYTRLRPQSADWGVDEVARTNPCACEDANTCVCIFSFRWMIVREWSSQCTKMHWNKLVRCWRCCDHVDKHCRHVDNVCNIASDFVDMSTRFEQVWHRFDARPQKCKILMGKPQKPIGGGGVSFGGFGGRGVKSQKTRKKVFQKSAFLSDFTWTSRQSRWKKYPVTFFFYNTPPNGTDEKVQKHS